LPTCEPVVASLEAGAETSRVDEAPVVEQRRRLAEREVLAVRVTVEVLRREDLAQVGVAVELDADHVVRLPLEERGTWPQARRGGQRLAVVEVDPDEHT